MKTIAFFELAALVAITPPAHATAVHELIIIEHSATSLSVFYDNSSISGAVISLAPDIWALDVSTTSMTFLVVEQPHVWIEPENHGLANEVLITPSAFYQFVILSDVSAPTGGLPDGTATATFGFDLRDNQPISLTFDDRAADTAATVPDSGATFGLMSVCLLALATAASVCSLRRIETTQSRSNES